MTTDAETKPSSSEPKTAAPATTATGAPAPAKSAGSWSGWLVWGVISGGLAFAFELLILLITENVLWSSPGILAAVVMMFGAALAVSVPFALACRIALGINGFGGPPQETVARVLAWLTESEPSRAAHRVALLGTIGAGVGGTLVVSSAVIATLGNPFARGPYNAVLHAAAALAVTLGLFISGRAAFLFRRRHLQSALEQGKSWAKPFRTAARATAILVGLAFIAGAAGASLLLSRGLTPNVVYGAVAAILALVGVVPIAILRHAKRKGAPGSLIRKAAPIAVLIGLVGLLGGSSAPASRTLVARTGVLTTPVVRLLRGVTDFDSDGYSGLFGGGDCAPNDAAISPGMRDIIDNGIDENCNGADFTSSSVIPPTDPAFVDDHGLCQPNGCDFVLITVDSLRSDRLGSYTPGVELTPVIDAISDAGTRFDNAYCLGPGTILTVPQLFSVVHDTQLDLDWSRAREIGPRPLTEDNLLFPQVLASNGFNTGGIAGHFYLEPLRYGFEIYENRREHWTSNQEITSPRVTETAITMYDQLAAEPEPFFQWVHYYDPHHDYMPHEEGAEDWNDHDRYDAEVRFTDEWLGRFVEHVEANPRERPLVWILTADHGEGLGDHGIRYHNRNFYDELCRIPLIFQVPGAEPRAITGPVSLHDIGATVMNLAGLPPEPRFEGRSLVDSIATGAENPERLVFHQAVYEQGGVDYEIFGVSNSEWRLFWDRLNGTVELFDAVEDRREEHNLELQLPEVRNQLLENIEGFLRRVEP